MRNMVVAVIGFAYWWDRRTVIWEARREAIEFIEKEGVLRRLLDAGPGRPAAGHCAQAL